MTSPVPPGLFEARADGTIDLVGGHSPSSGTYHYPIQPLCPYTGADDVERVVLSREATLWAWTAVTAAPPGYTGAVPYGFGVVELTHERLRIVTRLTEPDPGRHWFGEPMTLVPEALPDGVTTWAFASR